MTCHRIGVAVLAFLWFAGSAFSADKPVKVFLLAGQSNMEGHGYIAAEPKRNGGKGSLEYLTQDKATADKFKHLVGKDGKWVIRDDVWVHYLDRKGKLTAGFGVKEDRIGPELGFGFVIGDAYEEPVLLIKLAWGGKSLAKDFRPPSSGGEVGPYYKEVVSRTKAVLKDLKKEFPEFGNRGYELAGFGWHQGWNDRINQAFNDEYEKNMAHFIRDIRKDLGVKNLPFVIAESGMTGPDEKHPRALSLMKAQAAVADYEEFRGNVAFVGTKAFWREKEVSPTGQGYHWNSNAESYYLIGEAMGKAMKELCGKPAAKNPLQAWKHSGTLMLLTTPEGANLPATSVVTDFPVLIRLHRDWFDFTQARPEGADVRFATAEGERLAHQIEGWDAKNGTASVWVRVPSIKGNSRLPLRMVWGKADAADASDAKAVFNESNGYLSVWHMGETIRDDVGTLTTKDLGTTPAKSVIGPARHFDGKASVVCGDKITTYPTGDSPHTTEAWFRPEKPNATLIGWGNDKPQGKVVMQFRGPPHIRMDCWFSGANVETTGLIHLNEWVHVAHVCQRGDSRMYVNGVLAGVSTRKDSPLRIASPAGLWIGNWRNQQQFEGDLDEVRVSKVARSSDWMRLQYENQKPMQTLVGPLASAGNEFSVKAESLTVSEGGRVRLCAQAGGAQKAYWYVVKGDREEVLAVDRFAFEFAPGRVTGDTPLKLRFKAVFPNEVKSRDIDLTIKEVIPDPDLTIDIPAEWDGRKELVVAPQITNAAALKAAGGDAADVRMEWSAGPLAVIKETAPGKLRLLRAQNSGPLMVTATLSNGGRPVVRSGTINVKEPATDAWVHRVPERDEKPEEGQFYARDDRNEGTLHCNGTLDEPADEVFLKVYCDEKPFATQTAKPGKDSSYALSAKLKPGLMKYRVEFGTWSGGKHIVLHKAGNLLCGDAYLITGQSNAEALDLPWETPRETSDWVRTYGGPMGRDRDGESWVRERTKKAGGNRPNLWFPAVWKFKPPEHDTFVGWWGMQLGKRLVESQKMPVCIINGALGGTRIDEHQRSPADAADLSTIYGRTLWRLREAKLTHGIRGIIWHQGENDQPADGPSGNYGWKNYHRYFVELAAGWKRDFPNVRHYYAFQIWPDSCAMGGREGAGDRLREQQRTLSDLFSNLSVMSTLGIRPPGGCHFPLEGYNEFARLLQPLIERDMYGKKPAQSITPPNLRRVSFADAKRDMLTLEFDQPVVWKNSLIGQFYLDGAKDKVAGGSSEGSTLTLKLKAPTAAGSLTYLKESAWSQDALLVGENGIAALTFCEVPISLQRR
ncbi:MAG: DUF2341 domain-containing protein [Gemmataceae bacterium]|nr:DUF2341 domain-containing protein [Gemmataceae bacterium]